MTTSSSPSTSPKKSPVDASVKKGKKAAIAMISEEYKDSEMPKENGRPAPPEGDSRPATPEGNGRPATPTENGKPETPKDSEKPKEAKTKEVRFKVDAKTKDVKTKEGEPQKNKDGGIEPNGIVGSSETANAKRDPDVDKIMNFKNPLDHPVLFWWCEPNTGHYILYMLSNLGFIYSALWTILMYHNFLSTIPIYKYFYRMWFSTMEGLVKFAFDCIPWWLIQMKKFLETALDKGQFESIMDYVERARKFAIQADIKVAAKVVDVYHFFPRLLETPIEVVDDVLHLITGGICKRIHPSLETSCYKEVYAMYDRIEGERKAIEEDEKKAVEKADKEAKGGSADKAAAEGASAKDAATEGASAKDAATEGASTTDTVTDKPVSPVGN